VLSRVRERMASWLRPVDPAGGATDPLLALSDAELHEELRLARAAVELARARRATLQGELTRLRHPDAQELETRRASLAAQVAALEARGERVRRTCGPLEALLEDARPAEGGRSDAVRPVPVPVRAPVPVPLPREQLPPHRGGPSARRASRPVGAPLLRG